MQLRLNQKFKEVFKMPRGKNPKPSFVKAGENPRNMEQTSDDLSTVDKGYDYVKQGEAAQIGH